ncbi:MAG: HDOD domain-containing protein [Burkholderiaceae bacterium]
MPGSLLAGALIGYEPIVGRSGNALAMRVTVELADRSADLAALYRALSAHVPGGGAIAVRSNAAIDEELLRVEPLDSLWVEVPAATTATPQGRQLVAALHRCGFPMVLAGIPPVPLAVELVPAFRLSVIHVDDDRRVAFDEGETPARASGVERAIPFAQEGVRTVAAMKESFARGAFAVVGWPMDDVLRRHVGAGANPDYATIVELMSMIERGEDTVVMERLIRRDPALAWRLLRYINSPGFGLRTEVQSFRHAVMMLGYARLERWLALLLATSSRDPALRPVMIASFRRGVLLEHLIGAGRDERVRDELFILGVFSMLDRILDQSFAQLFEVVHVPARVRETLVERRGPYVAYLEAIEAIERGPGMSLERAVHACSISLEQCNHAVLRALSAPDLVAA